eukprot:TRINITY_DN58521_c0_g1_i1.p1 TRINITY_DN58521_c0_g1~~TRINITY_DN58521_c0_g1_i1.p1  ORF type:complete len:188 (-),score=44.83 TRINITY_DN58521_c0_g1_i1:75-560(-)
MGDNGLTEEQSRELTDAFQDLDKNRTGYLSTVELGLLMRSLGHTLSDEDLRSVPSSGERSVSLTDFLTIMAKKEQDIALQEKLHKAFAVFDRDGSGFINVDELRAEMMDEKQSPHPYTKEDFENFMSEYYAEAPTSPNIQHPAMEDGLMDYMEFIKLMLRK